MLCIFSVCFFSYWLRSRSSKYHKLLAQFHLWSNYSVVSCQKKQKNIPSYDRQAHLVSPRLKAAEHMWVKTKGSKATSALAREFQTNAELLMFSHTLSILRLVVEISSLVMCELVFPGSMQWLLLIEVEMKSFPVRTQAFLPWCFLKDAQRISNHVRRVCPFPLMAMHA